MIDLDKRLAELMIKLDDYYEISGYVSGPARIEVDDKIAELKGRIEEVKYLKGLTPNSGQS